jgi:hypothetical protein
MMTGTVPEMRTNNTTGMDIDQLRGWAAFMDRAMIVSLAAVITSVMALGTTTWLSFKFGGAVRAHEHSMLDQYKAMEGNSAQSAQEAVTARDRVAALEKEVSAARQRTAALEQEISKGQGRTTSLEQEVSSAQGRTAALERELSAAQERAAALEQEASAARERAGAFEQAAREANERVARASRESPTAGEKAPAGAKPQAIPIDAAEIQQRLANLGKLVREAATRSAEPAGASPSEAQGQVSAPDRTEAAATDREEQPSSVVEQLRKYAGTKAAVFVVQPVADGQTAGAAISTYLSDSGWVPGTWTWTGVGGIFGVVVLVKDGSDAATNEAASAFVEAMRSVGFNVTKGDWPANWGRFRGMLDGPQTPGPTDAAIRIVIGAKPR